MSRSLTTQVACLSHAALTTCLAANLQAVPKRPPKPKKSPNHDGDKPHYEGKVVPKGGWLLGSSASLFVEQWAGDIYLHDYWDVVGWLFWVTTISPSWGMSMAVVETAFRPAPAQQPTPWQIEPHGYLRISVVDRGQQPITNPHRLDVPIIATIAPPLPPIAVYQLAGGAYIVGHSMPWHHTVELTKILGKTDDNNLLHYHKHDTRVGHRPAPPILPRHRGKHYILNKVVYTTQVQNCRRVVGPGTVELEDEEED